MLRSDANLLHNELFAEGFTDAELAIVDPDHPGDFLVRVTPHFSKVYFLVSYSYGQTLRVQEFAVDDDELPRTLLAEYWPVVPGAFREMVLL